MKALLLVGGITDDLYLAKALEVHPNYRRVAAYYDCIYEIDTEQHFDYWQPWQGPSWDRFGDVLKFLLNPWRRASARGEVESKVRACQAEGYDVTLLTHSLGSWIIADCQIEVKKAIMMGSPLSFPWLVGESLVKWEIGKPSLRTRELIYLYGEPGLELVCDHPLDPDFSFSELRRLQFNTGGDHSAELYLNFAAAYELLTPSLA